MALSSHRFASTARRTSFLFCGKPGPGQGFNGEQSWSKWAVGERLLGPWVGWEPKKTSQKSHIGSTGTEKMYINFKKSNAKKWNEGNITHFFDATRRKWCHKKKMMKMTPSPLGRGQSYRYRLFQRNVRTLPNKAGTFHCHWAVRRDKSSKCPWIRHIRGSKVKINKGSLRKSEQIIRYY